MALLPYLLVLISLGICLLQPHGSGLCPSTNVTLQEGSSKILTLNITSNSNMLDLRKMNESTSAWEIILHIHKGHVNFLNTEYEGYFHISSNSLAVKSAHGLLNGYYQVVYSINSTCLHQFFLKILGSKGTQDTFPWIRVVLPSIVAFIFLVLIVLARSWQRRTKRGSDGNEQFQSLPRNENGSPLCLRNGIQMDNLDHVAETRDPALKNGRVTARASAL